MAKTKHEGWFELSELPPIRPIPGRPRYFLTRKCELYHLLRNGFFSRRQWMKSSPNRKRDGGKVNYLFYKTWDFPVMEAHAAMMLTWGTPKPFPDAEIDHRNGDPKDNDIDNLEWVTKEENNRRRWILYGLRKVGICPANLSPDILNMVLDPNNHIDPETLIGREMSRHAEGER